MTEAHRSQLLKATYNPIIFHAGTIATRYDKEEKLDIIFLTGVIPIFLRVIDILVASQPFRWYRLRSRARGWHDEERELATKLKK